MKKLIAIVILLSAAAFGQGVRIDLPPIISARGTPVPNVIVTVCTAAATGVPCSPTATTFTDGTLGTACGAGNQVVLTGTSTCQGTSDSLGNAGFWLSPGSYTYTLSGPGVTGKIYNLTVPVGANPDGSLGPIVATSVSAKTIEKVVYLDQFTDMDAAIAALPNGGEVHVPCGNFNLPTSPVLINVTGITIKGEGFCSNLQVTSTNENFTITGQLFWMDGIQVTVTTPSTRAGVAFIHVTSTGGAQGLISNVRFTGSVSSPNNGIIFFDNTPGAGAWDFRELRIPGGTTWTSIVKVVSAGPASVASINGDFIKSDAFWTDAAIVYDGYIDTANWSNIEIVTPPIGTGPIIWARNTVSGPNNPRWIHFVNSNIEDSGVTAIQLDASRDFSYRGYIATCNVGVNVGAAALYTDLSNIQFVNIANQAIVINATASHTTITRNQFDDIGNATNNTFNIIDIAANASDFSIIDNRFRTTVANQPKNGINIAAGTSNNFAVAFNDFAGPLAGLPIVNGGSGGAQELYGNVPQLAAGVEKFASPITANGAVTFNVASQFNAALTMNANLALTAGQRFQINEGTAVTATAGADICYADSTVHALKCSYNNGVFGQIPISANLLTSITAPTIAAAGCGGSAATIATNNGTAAFSINVGTAPTAAGCVVTLPTATNGWNCYGTDITTNSTAVSQLKQTATGSSATAATIVNYSDLSVATAPTANDIWQVSCFAR